MWDQGQGERGEVGDGGTRRALDHPRGLLQTGTDWERVFSRKQRSRTKAGRGPEQPVSNTFKLQRLMAPQTSNHSLLSCPLQKGKDQKFKKLNCY